MRFVFAIFFLLSAGLFAQTPPPGRAVFEAHCSVCHGTRGNGGELGPAIAERLLHYSDTELNTLIHEGLPNSGMPANNLTAEDTRILVEFLHTLRSLEAPVETRAKISLAGGAALEGRVMNQSSWDVQLLTDDGRIHLLRKDGDVYRQVTSEKDWPSYNGEFSGNRYTTLDQINKSNVGKLAPTWVFTMLNVARLQTTPIVVDGIMYVTSANECYALDAGSGREIWHYQRRRTKNLVGNAAGGINRGAAVAGDRLFMVTDNAHIIGLNRFTGRLLWETVMADWHLNYNATAAPLAVDGMVISGTAGGDEGARGFVAAFDQATGKEVWRFWTVPKRGEPGSETWRGDDIDHPSGATWLTGTYDPQLHTLYWPTGNPGPDLDGDQRGGDNLYTSSIVALDVNTGKMKWYFQYTPHNVWDWDAEQPPVLVDTTWNGQPRKLLLHANRNGVFYVLDRTDGKLLLARPFVRRLTWASGIDKQGRPILNPNQEPTEAGNRICPSLEGGTNWFSTSFNPATGLYYVQTMEKCDLFTKRAAPWRAGSGYFGGSFEEAPGDKAQKILRAINIETGAIAWELPQTGPANSWGGTLSTASGLVFFCEDSGALMAVDATDGKPLWKFQANQLWKASPMTYRFDGKQYVAVASGSTILAFALMN
ncbi:MAG TPA: PQQ-dependent dehydrogenase, methanol/ethanol family [Bryobacteraceae bacterium]|nr:PQQ-dependent dehydrogenase, methanol/ethanol family [Bryobacteraceae bacterium]